MTAPRRVLMVCMGNICRSPTAEGVLRHKLREAGLAERVLVDSAGTHAYHVGDPPDPRAVRHARRRGYDLAPLRARQVSEDDFERFDLLLAMDWENFALLEQVCPRVHIGKLRRLSEFARRLPGDVVPDPYMGDAKAFEHVLDLVEDACDGLVDWLRGDLQPRTVGTS